MASTPNATRPRAAPPSASGGLRTLYRQVALWQGLVIFALCCLVWVKEILDLPALLFGAEPSPMDWLGASIVTAGVVACGLIVVGHTYLQQRRILRGFINVCAYCRKVHVGDATWQQMEAFIENRTLAEFSHGVCPDCYTRVMEEFHESDGAHAE